MKRIDCAKIDRDVLTERLDTTMKARMMSLLDNTSRSYGVDYKLPDGWVPVCLPDVDDSSTEAKILSYGRVVQQAEG